MVSPRVFVGEAGAALHAEAPDDLEDDVLRVDAAAEPPVHGDAPHLQRLHRQALRRQHVAHLRRADAERDGAERAVRGGVAVAAGDRHARLRQPQLRADHVDDALVAAVEIEQPDAVLAAVPLERGEHVLGHHVEERPPLIARRDDVIDGADGALRASPRASPRARSMSNACGVVTSWMRWRPTNSCVWPFGRRRTVCACQTFSKSVCGHGKVRS